MAQPVAAAEARDPAVRLIGRNVYTDAELGLIDFTPALRAEMKRLLGEV